MAEPFCCHLPGEIVTLCVVDGRACRCQPEEGHSCPGVDALRRELAEAQKASHAFEEMAANEREWREKAERELALANESCSNAVAALANATHVPEANAKNAWKEAVIEACVVNCIGWDESNPMKSVADLISWEVQIALDPAVSSDAQALIERGKRECMNNCKEPK
jgi:hypothetical protein